MFLTLVYIFGCLGAVCAVMHNEEKYKHNYKSIVLNWPWRVVKNVYKNLKKWEFTNDC